MYYFHNLLGSKNSNEPNWRRKLHKHLVPPSKIDLSFKDNCKVLMYTKKTVPLSQEHFYFFLRTDASSTIWSRFSLIRAALKRRFKRHTHTESIANQKCLYHFKSQDGFYQIL